MWGENGEMPTKHQSSSSADGRVSGLLLASLCALVAALGCLAAPGLARAGTCSNEEFRTGAAANLPDCRGYELVTPPFKEAALSSLENGGLGPRGFFGMSANGLHVDLFSVGDFGDAQSALSANSYELSRTESGWGERNIDLPAAEFPASSPIATTPEFNKVLYEARSASESIYDKDLWLREAGGTMVDLGPFYSPASTVGPPGSGGGLVGRPGEQGVNGFLVGASTDLSHVVFEASGWPGDGNGNLFEYVEGQGGPPALVSATPAGEPCRAEKLNAEGVPNTHLDEKDVSADGSTVFFGIEPGGCPSGGPTVNELYARIDAARTVAISEPSAVDCSACDTSPGVLAAASFDGASADGSKVFFTTTQPLLGSDPSANVYEYDFDAPQASSADPDGRIVPVSAGDWGVGGAQVQEVLKVSEDGSRVYFTAAGALSGARNTQGAAPIEGEPNLYVFERDAQFPGGRLSFIATTGAIGSASVTPADGQFVVFTSSAKGITPGDTSTAPQVFEYDAGSGSHPPTLVRVSIGQNGFNDNGNTDRFYAEIPPEEYDLPRAVSENGEYVVFQSPDGLTPAALNGWRGEYERLTQAGNRVKEAYYAQNVYEYHDGDVYLVSDGQDTSYNSTSIRAHPNGVGELGEVVSSVRVRGLSPSGDDIFFETDDRLAPQDLDTQVDLYDARIEGGFPAPVSLLPGCSGDACQGQLSSTPTLLSPGSESQAGESPPLVAEPAAASKPKSKALTPAQKLANALRTCKKNKAPKQREACEKRAHKQYPTAKKAQKASDKKKDRS